MDYSHWFYLSTALSISFALTSYYFLSYSNFSTIFLWMSGLPTGPWNYFELIPLFILSMRSKSASIFLISTWAISSSFSITSFTFSIIIYYGDFSYLNLIIKVSNQWKVRKLSNFINVFLKPNRWKTYIITETTDIVITIWNICLNNSDWISCCSYRWYYAYYRQFNLLFSPSLYTISPLSLYIYTLRLVYYSNVPVHGYSHFSVRWLYLHSQIFWIRELFITLLV